MPTRKRPLKLKIKTYNVLGESQGYKDFRKETNIDIDFKTFKKILLTINEYIMKNKVMNEAKVFIPPGELGQFFINKYKGTQMRNRDENDITSNFGIDWVKSKEYKKRVYILNLHSDQYKYKWFWYKSKADFLFKGIYRFKPLRKYSRELAKVIKGRQVEYYEHWRPKESLPIDALKRIQQTLNRAVLQYDLKNNLIKRWDTRDEFIQHYNISLSHFRALVNHEKRIIYFKRQYIIKYEQIQ